MGNSYDGSRHSCSMFASTSGAEAGRFRDRTSDPGTAVHDDDENDYDDDNTDNDKDGGNTGKWTPHKKLRLAPPKKHGQSLSRPSSSSETLIEPARLDLAVADNDEEYFPYGQQMFSHDSEEEWEEIIYIEED